MRVLIDTNVILDVLCKAMEDRINDEKLKIAYNLLLLALFLRKILRKQLSFLSKKSTSLKKK